MTQLQFSDSQKHSSAFLRQLLAIEQIQLGAQEPSAVCTNLPENQLGGVACTLTSSQFTPEKVAAAQLVVRTPALTLAKLEKLQLALDGTLTLGAFRPRWLDGDPLGLAVVFDVLDVPAKFETAQLDAVCRQHRLELNLLRQAPSLNKPGLMVMDMDSTVIQMECIDELAKLAGVGDKVSAVTEQAMQGKLDFAQSLRERVACLKGADQSILAQVQDAMPLMPGVETLVQRLKHHGWKVVIASGGFTYFADNLKQRLGLDAAVSNVLGLADGKLTGEVDGRIVDAQVKAQTLTELARQWNIAPGQTVAMGDGANDLVMMEAAGLGVAYRAKPVVGARADSAIRFGGLEEMLYLLDPA
ncbi:Phosphoserine phosphatase [Saliniradius amylolyticus]|uniref:Phosphoserine phosphatase n=1 Tax=Saliniradius amylolyticus TaxID=2183582 RepID=A0A2S2E321_9ALTE|nr:phosphoserine phosphatase SerB [Saliniradius amylolyticus]AWL11407.1 Phosphoserine phosphatase [Saliniradius amylolyticus]